MTYREEVEDAIARWVLPSDIEHAGTRSAALGADFENLITISNKRYEVLNLGLVCKNNVRTKLIEGRLVHCEKQTVDYTGFLHTVGFIAFDAKSTEAEYFRPAKQQLHQLAYLLRLQRMGGRGFYLIERRWRDEDEDGVRLRRSYYLVEDLEAMVDAGRYEFHERDLCPEGPNGILLDYRQKLLEAR